MNLKLDMEYDPQGKFWICSNEVTLMYGVGNTVEEAKDDFHKSLNEVYTHEQLLFDSDFTLYGLKMRKKLERIMWERVQNDFREIFYFETRTRMWEFYLWRCYDILKCKNPAKEKIKHLSDILKNIFKVLLW